jgi:hypothetical protein
VCGDKQHANESRELATGYFVVAALMGVITVLCVVAHVRERDHFTTDVSALRYHIERIGRGVGAQCYAVTRL